jgi:hypothetical protein
MATVIFTVCVLYLLAIVIVGAAHEPRLRKPKKPPA